MAFPYIAACSQSWDRPERPDARAGRCCTCSLDGRMRRALHSSTAACSARCRKAAPASLTGMPDGDVGRIHVWPGTCLANESLCTPRWLISITKPQSGVLPRRSGTLLQQAQLRLSPTGLPLTRLRLKNLSHCRIVGGAGRSSVLRPDVRNIARYFSGYDAGVGWSEWIASAMPGRFRTCPSQCLRI